MLTQSKIQTMNGAKLVINTLKDLGVDTIFGYPGGVVLELYDELYKQKDIKHMRQMRCCSRNIRSGSNKYHNRNYERIFRRIPFNCDSRTGI